jgi:hypothetical protein
MEGAQSGGQLYAVSLVAVVLGTAIIIDWQGWGTRWYEWQNRADLPGIAWIRSHGGSRLFRTLNGTTLVVLGIATALLAIFHVS